MRGEAVALRGKRHRRNKPLADDDDHRNVVPPVRRMRPAATVAFALAVGGC
jgi:hypothetical protein